MMSERYEELSLSEDSGQLLERGDFVYGPIEMINGDLLSCIVSYMDERTVKTYEAKGEDEDDIYRDWAYKYLELFS